IQAGRVRTILTAPGIGSIGADIGRAREPARHRNDGTNLPAAEERAADTVLQEGLAGAERQLVEHRHGQAMADVEHRRSPLAIETEAVLREQRVAVERPNAAAVVRRL